MERRAVLVLVYLAFAGGLSVSHAAVVKSVDDLPLDRKMALQQSENRLIQDDRVLQQLESDRQHKKISAQNFAWQYRDVLAYIDAEANFQNNLLAKGPASFDIQLPDGATKVLRTVGKYSIEIPCVILTAILKGGGNFSP